MSREPLHELVERHPHVVALRRRQAAELARHEQIRARYDEADRAHKAAMAEYRAQLDAGTATGPPPAFHPPADMSRAQHNLRAMRDEERQVLAEVAAEVEPQLRARADELVERVAAVVAAEVVPAQAELAGVVATVRRLIAVRGYAVANTNAPTAPTLAALVDLAAHGGKLLPDELVPTPPPPPDWTADAEGGEAEALRDAERPRRPALAARHRR